MPRYATTRLKLGSALAALAVLTSATIAHTQTRIDSKIFDKPKPLPAFALTDHDARPFSNQQLADRWSLVLLGFTHCPDVCPFTLQNLALVVEELSTRVSPSRIPQVLFVGVDPDRDAPLLGGYVKHFDPEFVGLTGSAHEIKAFVEGMDGFVRIDRKPSDGGNYEVRHSAFVGIIGPDGKLHATLNPPMDPPSAAEFLTSLIRRHQQQQ